jgi:hypothetical protein
MLMDCRKLAPERDSRQGNRDVPTCLVSGGVGYTTADGLALPSLRGRH